MFSIEKFGNKKRGRTATNKKKEKSMVNLLRIIY
jgi:hypothetical protein